ncbi:hypothetical protein GCM10010185_36240 [Saccharothrix coeruleofusca]|uniref:Uncharacterized protein n=1 Tax=Saccharothrix coeruleofusca TaxID=33919 RepID=A0A918EEX6_9PSEU|nr:hypothetical protein GCM10010185_36240 [Saccharothrix coeruleofusca]
MVNVRDDRDVAQVVADQRFLDRRGGRGHAELLELSSGEAGRRTWDRAQPLSSLPVPAHYHTGASGEVSLT